MTHILANSGSHVKTYVLSQRSISAFEALIGNRELTPFLKNRYRKCEVGRFHYNTRIGV